MIVPDSMPRGILHVAAMKREKRQRHIIKNQVYYKLEKNIYKKHLYLINSKPRILSPKKRTQQLIRKKFTLKY